MKKLICLLIALTLVLSLFGCGKENTPVEDAVSTEAAEKAEETPTAESKENNQENIIALKGRKDDAPRSVAFTYDNTQLEVWDEDYYNTSSIELVKIDDHTSVLEISCKALTLDEIQAEIADVKPDRYEVSEFAESTFAGFPAWSCDILYKEDGSVRESYFIIEIPNGLYLIAEDYDGTVPLEEMLSYALLTIEEGDGTVILPPLDFAAENDDDVLTVNFHSGETFTLDYDQNAVNVYYDKKNTVEFYFTDEAFNEFHYLSCFISDQYATFEEYLNFMEETGYFYRENAPILQANLAGMELQYINDEWGGGYYFIPVTDTYALRGQYYYSGDLEQATLSALDIWEIITGATAEGETAVQSGTNESDAPGYDYPVPSELGETIESMTYALDGDVYQFPTPVKELLNNGWEIPAEALAQYPEIPAHDIADVALIRDGGASFVYNVVLENRTDEPMAIEDAIVTHMIVAQASNVDVQFPKGMSLNTTIEELDTLCDVSPMQNGNYSTFAWFGEEDDACTIYAWYHPEIGLEYFEFFYY